MYLIDVSYVNSVNKMDKYISKLTKHLKSAHYFDISIIYFIYTEITAFVVKCVSLEYHVTQNVVSSYMKCETGTNSVSHIPR
jgi:phosphate starvation-inducible membrane PsiE